MNEKEKVSVSIQCNAMNNELGANTRISWKYLDSSSINNNESMKLHCRYNYTTMIFIFMNLLLLSIRI